MTNMPMSDDEKHAHAAGGMLAAVAYTRIQLAGMCGSLPLAAAQAELDAIAADCTEGNLDLLGALSSIALRAAQLHANVTGISAEEFLDGLEREITPPDDLSGI
jgi:hypothetical protein